MVYDDIVIGSGLTSLATVLGLPSERRVCVIAGQAEPQVRWYDEQSRIPCTNLGQGGLGAYWHGVIPTGQPAALGNTGTDDFSRLFSYFYPDRIEERLARPWLFVPYRPIRPAPHWQRLRRQRKHLELVYTEATTVSRKDGVWTVRTGAEPLCARRIWVAAGALGTPALLERSPDFAGVSRPHLSDHFILYLGQIDRRNHPEVPAPLVERGRSGVWMQSRAEDADIGLVTTKPARFSYRQLDHGIEQRSAFGLPASGLVRKLYTAGSLGLIAESMFNKLGLFPDAPTLSVYAQVRIQDSYRFSPAGLTLTPEMAVIQDGIRQYREQLDWPALIKSRRPDLFIRGIHLHRSLRADVLQQVSADSGLIVADPSIADDIGPEHHSFKAMVYAYSLARASSL